MMACRVSVWESLAKMCIKTGRLDVAKICLGHTCNAKAALALRQAMKEPQLGVQLAILAIHLQLNVNNICILRPQISFLKSLLSLHC